MRGLPYKWRVLISVIFGIFMVILDSTVVNVAFPTLRAEFKASVSDSQWIISVYTMALGISTPLAGFLADRFSAKRIYVIGLALFVIGSFLCGVSPSLGFLIVARAIQGFGGGLALPLGTALLFGAFTVAEQGLAFGIFGIALVVAPALGPILGGLLVDADLWRWIFFINLPVGILGAILASSWLRYEKSHRKPRLDILGFLTSALGFGSVLYAASIAANDGWGSQQVITWFTIGGVSLLAFVIIELFVAKDPLLNLRLYRRPIFLVATVIGYVSVVALFGAEFLLPLYLQILRGKTALETGFILLPLAITSGIVAPFGGKLYDLFGPRIIMVAGFGLLVINTWQLSQITADTSLGFIIVLLAIRGVALGLTIQTTLVTSLSVVPGPEVARASALSNATRQVVQSIGVALLATVLTTTLSATVKTYEAQIQQTPATSSSRAFGLCEIHSTADLAAFTGGPSGGQSGVGAGPTPDQLVALIKEACAESVQGYDRAYQFTFYFAIAAMLLGALLPGWPFRWTGRKSAAAAPDSAPAPVAAH